MKLQEYINWEKGLKKGEEVLARWTSGGTSGGYLYEVPATILSYNKKSKMFAVALTEPVELPSGGYPVGYKTMIPSHAVSVMWSNDFGLFPLHQGSEGYVEEAEPGYMKPAPPEPEIGITADPAQMQSIAAKMLGAQQAKLEQMLGDMPADAPVDIANLIQSKLAETKGYLKPVELHDLQPIVMSNKRFLFYLDPDYQKPYTFVKDGETIQVGTDSVKSAKKVLLGYKQRFGKPLFMWENLKKNPFDEDDEDHHPADYMTFTSGDCWIFARALHEITGLPIYGTVDDDGTVHHAFVFDVESNQVGDAKGFRPLGTLLSQSRGSGIRPLDDEDLAETVGGFLPRSTPRDCPPELAKGYSDEEWDYALERAEEIAHRQNPTRAQIILKDRGCLGYQEARHVVRSLIKSVSNLRRDKQIRGSTLNAIEYLLKKAIQPETSKKSGRSYPSPEDRYNFISQAQELMKPLYAKGPGTRVVNFKKRQESEIDPRLGHIYGPEYSGIAARNPAWKDHIPGGLADNKTPADFDPAQLKKGIKVELEHTGDKTLATEIAMDHLSEDPIYYDKLEKMEKGSHLRNPDHWDLDDDFEIGIYQH